MRISLLMVMVLCVSVMPACEATPSGEGGAVEVFAWGNNDVGQLGDGTRENRPTPVKVVGLPGGVHQVSTSGRHSLALMSDGTVWAWGANSVGQLGNGTTENSAKPVKVFGLISVTMVAAGGQHSVAVDSNGTMWGWGSNIVGQLSTGTTGTDPVVVPVRASGISNAAQVAAGFAATYVVDTVGNLFAVGRNDRSQLGIGTSQDIIVSSPRAVVGVAPVTQVDAGQIHAVALRYDNIAWAWGDDYYGQLGDTKAGDPDPNPSPVRGFIVNGKNLAIGIAAGVNHTAVLGAASDGSANSRVWTVGQGRFGQLGNGKTPDSQSLRVDASNLTQVAKIDAGALHTLALDTAGRVWAWGRNLNGEIGDGTTTQRTTPVQVPGLSGVIGISAGGSVSFAIRSVP